TADQLSALSRSFQWKVYFAKVGLPTLSTLNVESPEFFKTLNTELKKEKLDSWKVYFALAPHQCQWAVSIF
ncbi:MAG TPA: hypothetical protein VE377_24940, partial [Candidatus Dormibacteraeota bacterium]|nr:hypothetical protein [Candidatus Dormibacteraeota bacterium]